MTDANLRALSALADRINSEHKGGQYLWRISKRGHRVHIKNPETGQAYCQAENCGIR